MPMKSFLNQLKTFIYFQKNAIKIRTVFMVDLVFYILFRSVQPFVMIVFPRYILDELMGARNVNTLITLLFIMSAFVFVCGIGVTFFQNNISKDSMFIKSVMRKEMGIKITKIEYFHLEKSESLDMMQRANKFLESDVDLAIHITPDIVSNIIKTIGYIFIISKLNILLIVLMLVIIAINVYSQERVERYAYSYREILAPVERKIAYMIMTTPDITYGKDIRLFRMSSWLKGKYEAQLNKSFMAYSKVFNKRTGNGVFTTVTNLIQTIFIYIWLIFQILQENITIGEFTMYLGAINNFSESVTGIFLNWVKVSQMTRGLKDYEYIMNLPAESEKKQFSSLSEINKDRIEIEFRDVWFKYPNQENFILKNISVMIYPKEKISIVGENGAGKTTFVKLLARLYQPTKGNIYINNIDINSTNIDEYRNLLSVVFQDYKLLNFTLKENIAVNSSEFDENKIKKVIHEVELSKSIKRFSSGMDAYIGTTFAPDGIQLSGGESQKLAIARALYKDSSIIILDEPTSALDPRAEYEIYRGFRKLVNNKTAFFISHRLSSSRFCDRILVFKDGQLIESGSHEELIIMNGLYHELYMMQAEFYTDD